MGIRKVALAALVLVVAMTGCNADRCPLDLFTVRERECWLCHKPMTVYRGETKHRCEVKSDQ